MNGRYAVKMVVVFVLLTAAISIASAVMSVDINCEGCGAKQIVEGVYLFWVDPGKEIKLTAAVSRSAGLPRYSWRIGNSEIYSSNPYIFKFKESVEYNLVVYDNLSYIPKQIKLIAKSIVSEDCLPEFREKITFRGIEAKEKWARGEVFKLRVRIDSKDCPNYNFRWETDRPSDVFIANPGLTETGMRINNDAQSVRVAIRAVLSSKSGFAKREQNLSLLIVNNQPPEFEISYDAANISSHTPFTVHFINMKARGEEDYTKFCGVDLLDENRKIASQVSRPLRADSQSCSLIVTPKDMGIYYINATVVDSHGASTIIEEPIEIGTKGATKKDIPYLALPKDVLTCVQYQPCKINLSKSEVYGYSATFRYYDAGNQIFDTSGNPCLKSVCVTIFTYRGKRNISIMTEYYQARYKALGEITVNVIPFAEYAESTVPKSPVPVVPVVVYTESSEQRDWKPAPTVSKKTPAPRIAIIIFAFLGAWRLIKRK